MEDNSVIKEGQVLVQKKRGLETHWVKRRCILHSKTDCRQAYLEIGGTSGISKATPIEFEDIKINEEKSSGKGLTEVEIVCENLNFLLRPPEDDLLDWIFKFTIANRGGKCRFNNGKVQQEDNVRFLKMITSSTQAIWYDVELLETDLSKRCGIAGSSVLIICKQKFRLIRPTLEAMRSFRFSWLKRIHRGNDIINVTIGKQSEIGEGILHFHSEKANALIRIIRVLMQISVQESKECTKNVYPLTTMDGLCQDTRSHDHITEDIVHELLLHELDTDRASQRKLTRKEYSTLSMAIGQGWEQIGFQLGLNEIELQHIEIDNQRVVKQIYEMLLKWDKKEDEEARLDILVKAMLKCPSACVTVKWSVLWNLINGL